MPTFDRTSEFNNRWKKLSRPNQELFKESVKKFVVCIKTTPGSFSPDLRVKGLKRMAGAYEMSWAPDGRAIWTYGDPVTIGETHVVWVTIGNHDIL